MNAYYFWMIGYIIIIYAIGLIVARKTKSSSDYAVADSSLGFWVIAGTSMATAVGSFAVIGIAGRGFYEGFKFQTTNTFFYVAGVASAFIFAAVVRKLKLYTVPELFARRYGKKTAIIPTVITGILYMVPTFGIQLIGMGSLLTEMFGVSVPMGIFIGFIICSVFTLIGGMNSVAWTDAIQSIFVIVGVGILAIVGVNACGGFEGLKAATPPEFFSFKVPFGELVNYLLVQGLFVLIWQTSFQRFTAAKNEKVAKAGVSVGFIVAFLMGWCSLLIGMSAKQFLPADTLPDSVYASFVSKMFSPGIGGFFTVTLFAVILTSATSYLLSGATNLAQDLYVGYVDQHPSDKKHLIVLRCSVGIMAVAGLLVAIFMTDIWTIYQNAISFSAACLVFPALCALFWKRSTKKGFVVATIATLVVMIGYMLIGRPGGFNQLVPGFFTNIIVFVAVSLMTQHDPEEQVEAYYFMVKDMKDGAELKKNN